MRGREVLCSSFLYSSLWHVPMKKQSLRPSVISMESSPLDRPWSSARCAEANTSLVILCVYHPQTRKSAGWLAGKMHQEGHAVALITGESTIDQRIAVLNRYHNATEIVVTVRCLWPMPCVDIALCMQIQGGEGEVADNY